jgi:hypothetical protein
MSWSHRTLAIKRERNYDNRKPYRKTNDSCKEFAQAAARRANAPSCNPWDLDRLWV